MGRARDSISTSKRSNLARVRSGGWHYLFVFIGAAAVVAVWGAILLPFYVLRRSLEPPDAFLSGLVGIGNILFLAPAAFPALAIGSILGRSAVRRIPAARIALEPELGDHSKTASQLRKYTRWGLLMLPGVLPLCFFGAMSSWAITPARIEVRPIFSATVHSYDWSSVRKIETGCTRARVGSNFHFVLYLDDATRIDLMQDHPFGFWAAYPKIQLALEGHSYGFSSGFASARCGYAAPGWQRMLSQPPTDQHSYP